nr:hypothetical protein [Schlegelella koreensis]
MQRSIPESKAGAQEHRSPYPSLDDEKRAAVDTPCAAWHLNRSAQTLRIWACRDSGPVRPIRVNGRLAWPVSQIRSVLGVGR